MQSHGINTKIVFMKHFCHFTSFKKMYESLIDFRTFFVSRHNKNLSYKIAKDSNFIAYICAEKVNFRISSSKSRICTAN